MNTNIFRFSAVLGVALFSFVAHGATHLGCSSSYNGGATPCPTGKFYYSGSCVAPSVIDSAQSSCSAGQSFSCGCVTPPVDYTDRLAKYQGGSLTGLTDIYEDNQGSVGIGFEDPLNTNDTRLQVKGSVDFNNSALIASQPSGASNVDHVWHDDNTAGGSGGTWNFVSDGTYKGTGNARLQAGHIWLPFNHENYIGGNILMKGGTDARIRRVGSISFDWTNGSYDLSRFHGIESRNEAGVWNDDLAINSFDGITIRLDSNNNNASSNFKIEHHSSGDGSGEDLVTVNSPTGNMTVKGDIRTNTGFYVDGNRVIDDNGGWHRSYGSTGWYNGTHGGGLYMQDSTWIRTYGNKSFYHNTGTMRTDGTFQVGSGGSRFIVNTAGNVGIGDTTPDSGLKLDVQGKIGATEYCDANGANCFVATDVSGGSGGTATADNLGNHTATRALNMAGFDINNAGDVTGSTFIYSSDERLKHNISTLDGSLEKVTALRGVSFDWNESGKQTVGLIAQEVENVYPELVQEGTDGYKAVEYGNLVAPLIEAVKELNEKVDAQNKKMMEQEQKIKHLENIISRQ